MSARPHHLNTPLRHHLARNLAVVNLQQIRASDYKLFGHKNANLGELSSTGVRVPEGFVISVEVFSRYMDLLFEKLRFDKNSKRPKNIQSASFEEIVSISENIRGMILRESLPEADDSEVQEEYGRISAKLHLLQPAVSVRSSAMSEDSAKASFAGVYDTFLWVRGRPALKAAIKKCYASMFSRSALDYRLATQTADPSQMLMSVGVLKMIDARSGGTLFSRGFSSEENDLLTVHSNWGSAASVVDGRFPVDSFEISKTDLNLVERSIAEKNKVIVGKNGRARIQSTRSELKKRPSISHAELMDLAQVSIKAEKHFGYPVDIEWCIEKTSDRLYLLQCRPLRVERR